MANRNHTQETKTKISVAQKMRWQKSRDAIRLANGTEIIDSVSPDKSEEALLSVGLRDTIYTGYTNITAQTIRGALDATKTGILRDTIRLFDSLRAMDAQLATAIRKRKSGLTSRHIVCKLAPGVSATQANQNAIKLFNQNMGLLPVWGIVNHLLDGFVNGIAVAEMVWEYHPQTGITYIKNMVLPSMAKFAYKDDDTFELYIDDVWGNNPEINGMKLSDFPNKFIVHAPQEISPYPNLDGLMRVAAFYVYFKTIGLAGLSAGLAKFAFPPVFAIVEKNTPKELVAVMRNQLQKFSNDHVGVFKGVTDVRTVTNGTGGGDVAYTNYMDYLDKQISKLILSNTMTLDDGASKSQGEVHERGESQIVRSDGEKLIRTLENQMLTAWLNQNSHLFPGVLPQHLMLEFEGLNEIDIPSVDTITKALSIAKDYGLEPTKESLSSLLASAGIEVKSIVVPAVDTTATGEQQTAPQQAVEETALNGAQVTAMQGLLAGIAEKTLAPEAAKLFIRSAFPSINANIVNTMVDAQTAFVAQNNLSTATPQNPPTGQTLEASDLSTPEEKPFVVSYTKPEVGQTWIDTTDLHRLVIKAIDPSNIYCVDLDSENPEKQFAWSVRHFREICRFESAPETNEQTNT